MGSSRSQAQRRFAEWPGLPGGRSKKEQAVQEKAVAEAVAALEGEMEKVCQLNAQAAEMVSAKAAAMAATGALTAERGRQMSGRR